MPIQYFSNLNTMSGTFTTGQVFTMFDNSGGTEGYVITGLEVAGILCVVGTTLTGSPTWVSSNFLHGAAIASSGFPGLVEGMSSGNWLFWRALGSPGSGNTAVSWPETGDTGYTIAFDCWYSWRGQRPISPGESCYWAYTAIQGLTPPTSNCWFNGTVTVWYDYQAT